MTPPPNAPAGSSDERVAASSPELGYALTCAERERDEARDFASRCNDVASNATKAAIEANGAAAAAEEKLADLERYRRSLDKELLDARAVAATEQQRRIVSDKRAAALAEALRRLVPILEQWHEEFPQDVGDKEAPALAAARAALAGNGTTTTGEAMPFAFVMVNANRSPIAVYATNDECQRAVKAMAACHEDGCMAMRVPMPNATPPAASAATKETRQ